MFVMICCVWGCSFILMKRALESFSFLSVGMVRVFFGAVALMLVWKWQKQRWPLTSRDMIPLTAVAIIGYAIPFCVQPYVVGEVQRLADHGGAFGGMMVSFVPLLTILVSIPMLGVYPTKRQFFGVIGGFACIYMLYREELGVDVPLRLLLLGSVTPLCYAMANTYVKRRFHHIPAVPLALGEMLITAAVLAPLALSFDPVQVNDALPMSIFCLLLLGVICTGIAGAMFYKLIQGHGPLYAGMVAYIIPCVAMLIGYLDGEQLAAGQLGAIAGIFIMVALVQFRPPAAFADALEPEIEP